MILLSADFFSKLTFQISISEILSECNLSVGVDLGPNCLQRLTADDTSRQTVNEKGCQ